MPAWTNETVTVYAVNSVGNGPRSTASGTAWARAATASLRRLPQRRSRHRERLHQSPGGAWTDEGTSGITWINVQPSRVTPAGRDQRVPVHHLLTPSCARCPATSTPWSPRPHGGLHQQLPDYQPPDTPHPIAYVSTTQIDSSSQHVCEYEGTTTGDKARSPHSDELSPCGTSPVRDDRRHQEVQLLDVSRASTSAPVAAGRTAQSRP